MDENDGAHGEQVALCAIDVHTPGAYIHMVIIETPQFSRQVQKLLSDEGYRSLQSALLSEPTQGVVIPGTGGLRKIRWAVEGRGKRGGVRVIYFLRLTTGHILMLCCHAKNDMSQLTRDQLRRLSAAAARALPGDSDA
jgi:mRNA-degrading endonuclease RelE of RelBE toxin-antitoxin system